jgi:hypothetical protein
MEVMTPTSRRCSSKTLALLTLLSCLACPAAAQAWGSTIDPVFVFYPEELCEETQISLELWNRLERRWVRHPQHPLIHAGSCQLEDAGVLFNEIRWRCPQTESRSGSPWNVGLRVFRPRITQYCEVTRSGSGFGKTEIQIYYPEPEVPIRDPDPQVSIAGSVRVGGLVGGEYDVMIAIDTSAYESVQPGAGPRSARLATAAARRLAAQVQAVRAFVAEIRWRLGPVRVGLVSFPGHGPDARVDGSPAPEHAFARRTLALTDDPRAIERALVTLAETPPAGPMSFSEGLALAVDELFRPPSWPGAARPQARRIVILAADGSGGFPFGPAAQADREFLERNLERARSAAKRGVALHLFALGGLAEKPPPFIEQMLAAETSSFTRVHFPAPDRFLADRVSMPHLEGISIRDAATGRLVGDVSYGTDGRFAATTWLAPGANPLLVKARISNGQQVERRFVFDFDDRAYHERVLAEEVIRIQRARSRRLVLEVEK